MENKNNIKKIETVGTITLSFNMKEFPSSLQKEMKEVGDRFGFKVYFEKPKKHKKIDKKVETELPDNINKLDIPIFSKVLLAIMQKHHKGKQNKAYSSEIAREIINEFPDLVRDTDYKLRSVSYGIIFAMDNGRTGLVKEGYIKMDHDEKDRRFYWTN